MREEGSRRFERGRLKDNLQKVVQHGQKRRPTPSSKKHAAGNSREGLRRASAHRHQCALLDESLNLAYHGARRARSRKREFKYYPATGFLTRWRGAVDLFPQEITPRHFLNLISNGFYAAGSKRTLGIGAAFETHSSARQTRNLGDAVEIRHFATTGIGIPGRKSGKRCSIRSFTTKPPGRRAPGLALSMSHDIIVKQHGGTIECR